ncbi:hypothetical protein C8Q75DRAFT_805854 [Abortiporus biennis]|nr:hypothetical protein C8Q75DRAFT_805854 [Abortiporus biennis]
MVSSLAAQLAQSSSLNSALLLERTRRKATQSYLFNSKEAGQHDIDSIYALGVNGFIQLSSLNPLLRDYEERLFSDAAKATDRTLLPAESNAELSGAIDKFLPMLGPYLLDAPTGKVLEWLVRRFRINEFNVEGVLALFLPYHESPHFVKMLSILHLKETSPFSSLIPCKSTTTPLSRSSLVKILLQKINSDFARFAVTLLSAALRSEGLSAVHRGLIGFHTSILLSFLKTSQEQNSAGLLNAETVALILSAAIDPLQLCAESHAEPSQNSLLSEIALSSFLVLAALSHTCTLSGDALSVIVKAVVTCAYRVNAKQLIRTLVGILSPQEILDPKVISKTVVKAIIKVPNVDEELKESLHFTGAENFVKPLLTGCINRLEDERALAILNTLITFSDLPKSIIKPLATRLISVLVDLDEKSKISSEQKDYTRARARSLLIHLQQRHPSILHQAFDDSMKDENRKAAVEQIVLSLSMDLPDENQREKLDMVVASMSADSSVRTIAVHDLYKKLALSDNDANEAASIRSALLTRVQDNNLTVVEALYSNPDALLQVVLPNAAEYVDTIVKLVDQSSPGKNLIKSHLNFIACQFYPELCKRETLNDLQHKIFFGIFFPYLLSSKPRHKTAAAVWDIVEESGEVENGVNSYELLKGCVDAVRWEEGAKAGEVDQVKNAEPAMKANLSVASKIAENIVTSDNFQSHINTLLPKIQDKDPHIRTLASLVSRSLLSKLSGEHQLDVAHRVLKTMALHDLENIGEFLHEAKNIQEFLNDSSLRHAIYHKPSSRNTVQRIQASLLVMLPTIPRPTGVSLNWVDEQTISIEDSAATKGTSYVLLVRAIYKLANTSSASFSLSTYLLRMLFIGLGDDALAFLAGTWLEVDDASTCYAALRHAVAFLEAHRATQHLIDFQTVLPAILVALCHNDQRVRGSAVDCISVLLVLCEGKKPSSVYAFDAIYGPRSSSLQYVDWSDFTRYIQALAESRDHFLHDPTYLRVVHQQFSVHKGDSKKEIGYKQRLLCSLISHIKACRVPSFKVTLLKSIESVSNAVKLQMLLPVIEELTSENTASSVEKYLGSRYEEFACLLVSAFNSSAVKDLNNVDSPSCAVYQQTLRYYFLPGNSTAVRHVLASYLKSDVFARLQIERKVEICELLFDVAQQSIDVANECRSVLSDIVTEAPLIIHLLVSLSPSGSEAAQRATKRSKVEQKDNNPLWSLGFFSEILGSITLPGSVDLLSTVLDTLSKVVQESSSTGGDKIFIQQLLLSALDNVISNIPANQNVSSSAIRIDVLVELIRVSENPQTFNQALLSMASLARLAPDAVLHNIMPVFTFMGSNVFHRDDSYSFRVVQKTIESIVPVMTFSLKTSHSNRLDLWIASRKFLRIFSDAANHVPRHRRTSFFSQLIDALGASEYLAPVSLLLIDRMANRVSRQNATDALASLTLPLSVFQRYPESLRLQAMIEMLDEVEHVLKSEKSFLELSTDEEKGTSSAKRQAQSILIFIGHGLAGLSSATTKDSSTRELLKSLLGNLLKLAVPVNPTPDVEEVAKSAQAGVTKALSAMTAFDFVNEVLTVIQSEEIFLQKGALDLLGTELANVNGDTRKELTLTIKSITVRIQGLLSNADESLLSASFHALNAIAQTLCPGEEGSLTNTVPVINTCLKEHKSLSSALKTMLSLVTKLGPRIIPYFKDIVKTCVGLLRADDLPGATSSCVKILQALLSSIPKFWSASELNEVIELYLDSCIATSSPSRTEEITSLMKSTTKKSPPKVLIPLLCEMWAKLSTSDDESSLLRLSGYFNVLKRAIRVAPRPVIAETLRPLFKTFLSAFQLCASSHQIRVIVESPASSTFLDVVVKLNETAFKPLFRKMFDWAFTSEGVHDSRRLVFCHVYSTLLDYFKGLMTPYMSFLLQPFINLLNEFSQTEDVALWDAVIQTLTRSFVHDDGAYWRDDKLRQLTAPLIAQVAVCIKFNSVETKSALTNCLLGLIEIVNDDSLLKSINIDILMHTRSEDSRLRLYALTCSEAIWKAHGSKLMGFVAETSTFIAESAEDENDSVVREAHRLKEAVENVAGAINF